MRYSGGGHCGAIHCQLQAVAPSAPLLFLGGVNRLGKTGKKKEPVGSALQMHFATGCLVEWSIRLLFAFLKLRWGYFPVSSSIILSDRSPLNF